jgi:membrane dipeptidase
LTLRERTYGGRAGAWVLALALLATPGAATAVPVMQADLHLDTPSQLVLAGHPLDAGAPLQAGLPRLREGGTNLAVMVLWPGKAGVDHRARMFALLEKMEAEIARLDGVVLVRSPAEARAAAAEGRVGIVFALEGAHGLGADWQADVADLHARGVAMLGLTWSMSNRFAGSSGDGGGGLTADGHALVDEARRRGLLLDVSHASDATTQAVCLRAPAPVVASHSDAHAVRAHDRNLRDELLRCIAESGGVVGLNFHAPFVAPAADADAVARHAAHMARVAGPGVLALGSDFDGWIRTPLDLPHAGALPSLWPAMRRAGLSGADVQAARGENFLRAWQGALDASAAPRGE